MYIAHAYCICEVIAWISDDAFEEWILHKSQYRAKKWKSEFFNLIHFFKSVEKKYQTFRVYIFLLKKLFQKIGKKTFRSKIRTKPHKIIILITYFLIEKYFECIISATACFQVSIILVVLEKFGKYLLQNSKHRQSYKIKYNNKLRENHKFRIIFLVKISSKYSFDCC